MCVCVYVCVVHLLVWTIKKLYKMHSMYIKNHIADLIHLVSALWLINFDVDNFVYTMIPSSSYVSLLCCHY